MTIDIEMSLWVRLSFGRVYDLLFGRHFLLYNTVCFPLSTLRPTNRRLRCRLCLERGKSDSIDEWMRKAIADRMINIIVDSTTMALTDIRMQLSIHCLLCFSIHRKHDVDYVLWGDVHVARIWTMYRYSGLEYRSDTKANFRPIRRLMIYRLPVFITS